METPSSIVRTAGLVLLSVIGARARQIVNLPEGRPPRPLPACDAIVIADPSGLSARRDGVGATPRTVQATLHVQRVVKGNLQPGSSLQASWQESPTGLGNGGFDNTASSGSLWLLANADSKGTYRAVELGPFLVSDLPQYFYLPMPAGDLPADLTYRAEDTVDTRLSRELEFALESMARTEGDRLKEVRDPASGVILSNPAMHLFSRTAELLSQVHPDEALVVYRKLAASSVPSLQLVGRTGLARLGH